MHKIFAAVLLASAFAWADDTQANDANAAVLNAKELFGKQEGYHASIKGGYSLGEGMDMPFTATTVVKGDLAHSSEVQMNIPTETYRKGGKMAVKDAGDGEWKDPSEVGSLPVGNLQDPKAVMGLIEKCADTATFQGEEKIGDVDCKRVVLKPKPEILKDFIAAQGFGDLQLDYSKAKIDFQAWIGKDDKLFHRLLLKGELEQPMADEQPQPGQPKPEPMKVSASVDVGLSDYNKNLDFDIPDKVKKLLGL